MKRSAAILFFLLGILPLSAQLYDGFLDRDGNTVVEPRYDAVSDFDGGYALVGSNGNFGLIDSNGNEVIPYRYDYAEYYVLWRESITK